MSVLVVDATLLEAERYRPTVQAEYLHLLTTLRRCLSFYCLIRYVGQKHGPQPVIGVVLVQPGSGAGYVRSHLAKAGLFPYSPHWRQARDYLALLAECVGTPDGPQNVQDLQAERVALATWPRRWQRVLAFSPVYTALGDPEHVIAQIFEEDVMAKAVADFEVISVGETMESEERSGDSSLCATITHLAPHMSLKDVEVFMRLLVDQADEDAYATSVTLLRRMIDLLVKRAPAEMAGRVERIILASERVVRF